jgi:hypothetical protein
MQYDFFGYFLSATVIVFVVIFAWFGQQLVKNGRVAKRLEEMQRGSK